MKNGSHSREVLIVGAGIIGIACAHYLAKTGRSVTVIDQRKLAGGCSHGNCGYICPSHVLPLTEPSAIKTALKSLFNPKAPFRVKPQLDPTLWQWMWQFAKRCNHRQMIANGKHLQAILNSSMQEYQKIIAEEKLECEWKEEGLLYVFRTAKGLKAYAETDRLLSETFGIKSRPLAGDELSSFDAAFTSGLAGGFHYPGDASLRPDLLNQGWIERLKARGVRFIENCKLVRVTKSKKRISNIHTTRGEWEADEIVFCLGAWSPRLCEELGCKIPIQPGKGYSITMSSVKDSPKYPMLFPEEKVGISPFREGFRIGSMMEFAGYDRIIPPRRIAQLKQSARPYLHTQWSEEGGEPWYGWRPMTWDSLPIIGRVPSLENAFLATGHNMLGMSLATATGKLIAELIEGDSPHIDLEPYSLRRFQSGK
ncbi:D-amino acid dehydrogenase small subunit [Planctomycetales bacterium 10988]|nr:D-amino acid dehydrogenase small subunit [Planctomycetales bacterium 10988]